MLDTTKPNILFIGIDSFRGDKFFGPNKSSKTPNIDRLIEKGVYFDQHISVSDGSYTCMGAVFTSQYPFQSGLSTVSEYSKSTEIFQKFKVVVAGFPARRSEHASDSFNFFFPHKHFLCLICCVLARVSQAYISTSATGR